MSWIKKHWKYALPVAPLILCVLAASAYALYLNNQPPVVEHHYVMPEKYTEIPPGTDQVRVIQPELEVPTTVKASYVTIDAPEQTERERMIALRDELLAKEKTLLAKRDAQIAEKEALIAENKALRAEIARQRFIRASRDGNTLVGELHDWATTAFAERSGRIMPDLGRDNELGVFAEIEALELWAEAVERVSKLPPELQQQLMDGMRSQGYGDGADLMAHDLSQLTGGAQ